MATVPSYPDSQTVEDAIQTGVKGFQTDIKSEVDALSAGNVTWSYNAKTADYTIVISTDTYGTKVFTNDGATATVNYSLPAGAGGARVSFNVVDAYTLKVTANGSETIRYKSQQTAAGGYVQSAVVGDFWTLEWNGDEWVVTDLIGELEHASGNFGDQYRTFDVRAAAFRPCTTNGCAPLATSEKGTNDIDVEYLAFDGGATEERCQIDFKMPEDWDLGTVKCMFDWSSATGSTIADTIQWGVKAGAKTDDDVIDAALGTAQVISYALLGTSGADWQTTAATPALTIGGTPALKDTIFWEVYRDTDGTDNMAEDGWLFGMWVQYKSTKSTAAW